MLGILIISLEFVTFIFSIKFYSFLNKGGLGHLCFFLGMVFVLDVSGHFLNNIHFPYLGLFYSLLILTQQFYYLKLIDRWKKTKWSFPIFISIIIFGFFEFFSELEISGFPAKTIGMGAALLFFNGLIFLYKLVVKEQNYDFFKRTDFWLVMGITIYNALEFPYMIFLNTITMTTVNNRL